MTPSDIIHIWPVIAFVAVAGFSVGWGMRDEQAISESAEDAFERLDRMIERLLAERGKQ